MFYMANTNPAFSEIGISVILGGFGLFMLGIKMLGDGFKEAAGPKIRDYIEKYTGNLISAILVGTVITAIMQSSTAATVISISLVRAGLMSLEQAIGISIGANVGTTVTALMIGLNIEELGYYFMFVGAITLAFSNRKKFRNIGTIVFAFGITFVGLQLMGDRLALLKEFDWFENFMLSMSNTSWLALIAGTILTAIINSSTAVIALVQKIYESGGMTMIAASAFVFGSNVGTTLTAILASFGGSVSTRRAGWFHAIYNILGAVLMMFIIIPYSHFIENLNIAIGGTLSFGVGLNHFVFNILSTVLVIPFVPLFIKLLKIIIPGEDKIKERAKLLELDYNLIDNFPEGAMQLVQQSTLQMADLVVESIETSHQYLSSRDSEDADVVDQLEEMVNALDVNITQYLLAIAKSSSAGHITETYTQNLEVVKNFERMSDLTTNIVEFYALVFENREKFTPDAIEDLNTMYSLLLNIIKRSMAIYEGGSMNDFESLLKDEEYLDLIEKKYREKHFQRMAEGVCDGKVTSSVYVDILGILERIGDHAINVARYAFMPVKDHDMD
ncbi:MAG TPA: Na/Pi cotransporter family protein [Erysipelothrix sp.]|nr:Na/Pi cotransporter family protein [Erysipelothrix sp.]